MLWTQNEISEFLIAHRARGAICEDLQKENAQLKSQLEHQHEVIQTLRDALSASCKELNLQLESARQSPLCAAEKWSGADFIGMVSQ
jgi:predicted RNase H-like nuclease (RuvC/YqgF family)